jgi:hypothetical protein
VAAMTQSNFRSTIFGMPHSSSINKATEHDDTPEKSLKIKNKKRGEVEEDASSLPPIHQLRLDVKLNLYGATSKTQDNVFKKTLVGMKRKEEAYLVAGKKMDR